jgi:hypothetical protein
VHPSRLLCWLPILQRTAAVSVASAVLLTAAPLTALASTGGAGTPSNSGDSLVTGPTHEAGPAFAGPGFRVFHRPRDWYVSRSCAVDLSGIADFTRLDSVTGCGGVEVRFSSEGEKRSVPDSWGSWGSPPFTEDATPDIVYALSATAITLTYSRSVTFGGVELEPDPTVDHSLTAEFFSRPNGAGDLLGSITRRVDGDSGARLFGASVKAGFKSVVITSNDGVKFGFGQIRV